MAIAVSASSVVPGRGLTSEEAERRRAAGESNRVASSSSRTYTRILFENAFTPINTILFAIGIALVVRHLYTDALATAGLVMVNVVVGVFQEGRAKRQLDRIALLTRPTVKALRDGNEVELAPDEIVRGDLLLLQPGEQVQVDGKVIGSDHLMLDEALLTGESDLVPKKEADEVFSGTFCMAGSGSYEAEGVGAGSVANQITARARAFRNEKTPLQREVAFVIWGMAIFSLLIGLATLFSINHIYSIPDINHSSKRDDQLRAAAVIVALIPQGLSFMVTVTYALAAVRMSRAGALVQRLNAVESMSHIDVLCVDKTGTLTTNQLKLDQVIALDMPEAELRQTMGNFAASGAVMNRTAETLAEAFGGAKQAVSAEVPFDSSRKWSALAMGERVYVLGAPEIILQSVSDGDAAASKAKELSQQGLRVLLFAGANGATIEPEKPALPANLDALGLVTLRDELRAEAAETVAEFREAGIKLKIISGDNPETVASLARQAGFGDGLRLISGQDLKADDAGEMEKAVNDGDIFGRIQPQHKEALVEALRRGGHYVAMTGDGVNDVPALKSAQVSIAMRSGSPVTRSVADIVLLQDSFAALPANFEEGQRIRKGMEGIIRLFLVRTFAISLVILAAAILGKDIPVTPRQNSIPAVLTVGIPALVLAYRASPGRSPRYLLPDAAAFLVPAALTIGAASLTAYLLYVSGDAKDLLHARTALTVMSTLCGIALIPVVEIGREEWTKPKAYGRDKRLLGTTVVMLLVLAVVVTVPLLRKLCEIAALPVTTWLVLAAIFVAWVFVLRVVFDLHLYERVVAPILPRGWRPTRANGQDATSDTVSAT